MQEKDNKENYFLISYLKSSSLGNGIYIYPEKMKPKTENLPCVKKWKKKLINFWQPPPVNLYR